MIKQGPVVPSTAHCRQKRQQETWKSQLKEIAKMLNGLINGIDNRED